MKTYTYKGKERSAVGNIRLNPGQNVELDNKDKHVQALSAKGLLIELSQKTENKINHKKTKK